MNVGAPELLILLVMLAIPVALGAVAGSIARSKGRSYGAFFVLGFFFPLLGIIIAAVLPSVDQRRPA